MEPNRKFWNQQQQALRAALVRPDEHRKAMDLFLAQHAMLHSAGVSGTDGWSLEDEVWDGLTESAARSIPQKFEHSIVWCIWHLTRIEDITMNMLLAGTPQLFLLNGWNDHLNVPYRDTGNGMDPADTAKLSDTIDIRALRAYRFAVGLQTRDLINEISHDELIRKVDPGRLAQVMAEGAVTESGQGVIEYWGSLTGAGLLLMPPTRHTFVHLNEALRIKQKCLR
jgi:hypothetical protein